MPAESLVGTGCGGVAVLSSSSRTTTTNSVTASTNTKPNSPVRSHRSDAEDAGAAYWFCVSSPMLLACTNADTEPVTEFRVPERSSTGLSSWLSSGSAPPVEPSSCDVDASMVGNYQLRPRR
ncbi:hypothetical protein ACFQV2_13245 [Actinokineospora soli]|uniref:Uncharacterized protein n=1 Tax=Actinokineospora soli TaxID=1048753 RepID=A0ABW2TKR6_9PSEU